MYLLKNIKKVYADDKNKETALNNISISFPNSGMVFVVGKSGSGKTTLLNLLSFFDTPTEGTIEFLGVNINSVNDDKRSFFRKNYIGFVSQEFNLFNSLSVYENVVFSLEVQGKKINKTKIESLLERLGILEYKNKKGQEKHWMVSSRKSKEELEKVYDRFYQIDRSHSKEGSGLGLAIVKRIVELSEGKIEIKSKENKGTTVIVKLPVTSEKNNKIIIK